MCLDPLGKAHFICTWTPIQLNSLSLLCGSSLHLPVCFQSHTNTEASTLRRQINGLKKHSEDEKTDSLKGNKCNAIIPVAACLSVLWTLEKNRGTSQQGGCGHTLDYPLILHPLRYPQMGASLWTRLGWVWSSGSVKLIPARERGNKTENDFVEGESQFKLKRGCRLRSDEES